MSFDYLEELENEIDKGEIYFICPGVQTGEWHLSKDLELLRKKAQRAADARRLSVSIYRVVNKMDTMAEDSYVCVRRILEPTPRGEPRFHWVLVDTREAAEMMRDVSQGPSPYFGAQVAETFAPSDDASASQARLGTFGRK
ncbi:MAG TPA: hypothetical protein PLP17_08750 [Oligoflexia bacterium]|nr:hypothetical protein [Oligoflexia bacterium]